jgi:hypothetical protein
MERAVVEEWVASYVRVWRSPGTEGLARLFTPDASYLPSPWAEPVVGEAALATFWEAERAGPEEVFSFASEIVAVDGRSAVVRVAVEYGAGRSGPWKDLWVLAFADDGRCSSFEEWPFAPDQPAGI